MSNKKTDLDTILRIFHNANEPIWLYKSEINYILIISETPEDDKRIKLFFDKKTETYRDKTIE